MPKRFGTDGIRGLADADLSRELALEVGRAVGIACREGLLGGPGARRPLVVVGRDTRPSGGMLQAALEAGLCSAGADVASAGVLPTPGVAFLVADLGADAGIVVSGSHNPAPDNGIKVFGPGGWKLDRRAEEAVEALLDEPTELPTGAGVGGVTVLRDAEARYVEHLLSSVTVGLEGRKVVADCAHGAGYRVAPLALRRAGAEVVAINATGDGERINDQCGATSPGLVAAAARSHEAIGLAFDGDADRVLAADEEGNIVDGDAIIAMLASRLRPPAIVVTVMANQALRTWCARSGIEVVETQVGDRHVLEEMRARGIVLGGEQSGHIIRLDHATTGDGILTGLGLLEAVARGTGRLADAVPFRPLPQVLVNVRTAGGGRLEGARGVWDAVERARGALGESGRVLVRPSGTEPLVRVMVEAASEREAGRVARDVAAAVERELEA